MRRPKHGYPTRVIDRLELQIHYRGPVQQWSPEDGFIHQRLDAFVRGVPTYGVFGNTILQFGCDWVIEEAQLRDEGLQQYLVEIAKKAVRRGVYPVLRSIERHRQRVRSN